MELELHEVSSCMPNIMHCLCRCRFSGQNPVKTFSVGPNIPKEEAAAQAAAATAVTTPSTAGGAAIHTTRPRPAQQQQAPARRPSRAPSRARPYTPTPPYLDDKGRWVGAALPTSSSAVLHPSQTLLATSNAPQSSLELTVVDGAGSTRTLRPVAALHSYTDVSPLVTAEWVRTETREGSGKADGGVLRGLDAPPAFLTTTISFTGAPGGSRPPTAAPSRVRSGIAYTSPFASHRDTRTSQQLYWRGMPSSEEVKLTGRDLTRINDRAAHLGRSSLPGSAQSRLIGGQWVNCPREVNGDVVFTDYYGPLGGGDAQSVYYGRSYDLSTQSFKNNVVVEDPAYIQVRANMTGINTLRSRPGMALEGKLVHCHAPSRLIQRAETVAAAAAAGSRRAGSSGKPAGSVSSRKREADLHTIKTFSNIN